MRWRQLSVSAEGVLQIGRVRCLEPACTRCHHVLHQDGALRRRQAAHGTSAAMASAAAASSASAAASSASAAATSSATSFTQAATLAAELHRQYAQRHAACRTAHNEPPLATAVLPRRRRGGEARRRGGGGGGALLGRCWRLGRTAVRTARAARRAPAQ